MLIALSAVLAACLVAIVLVAAARVRRRRGARLAAESGGTRARSRWRWRMAGVAAAVTVPAMAFGLPSASAAPAPAKAIATSTTVSVPSGARVATPVIVTASVTPVPAGGSVSFSAMAGKTTVSLPGACATAPAAAGVATCTFTPATAAAYKVTATYSGTAGFKASASKPVFLPVTAAQTTTTVTVNGSPVPGSPLTALATIAPAPDAGTVSVTITTGSATIATCPGVAPSAGTASCAFTPASAGQYTVTAVYSGDASYLTSTGSGTVAVEPITVTETVSDNAASVAQGDPVVFTAVISAADGTAPAGSVSWAVSSTTSLADSSCASTTYSNGTATCTVNTYLDYSGDQGTLGGWDNQGHDLIAGDITATATFTPAGPDYASATASDSTVKVTSISITSPCQNCVIDTSGPLTLTATQTSLPPDQVEWIWECQGTGDCSWAGLNATGSLTFSSSTANMNIGAGTIEVNPIVCPVGVNELSGFACGVGPQDVINFTA